MKKNKKMIFSFVIIMLFGISLISLGIFYEKKPKSTQNKIKTETKTVNYKIQENDNLESLSIKYNIDIDELKKINNITSNDITKGTTIKIPNVTIYEVTKEDTYESILKKFHITGSTLKKANNLEENDISSKRQLFIPNTKIYITQKGDTAETIALKYGIELNYLMNYNNIKNVTLKENQIIIVPKQKGMNILSVDIYNSTVEGKNNLKELKLIGKEIYNKNQYNKFKKTEKGYTATVEDVQKMGYSDINDYLFNCNNNDEIMYFDVDHKKDYPNEPIIIKNGCNFK